MWSCRTHAWRYESESCTFDPIKKSVLLWLEIFMLENNGTIHPWWAMKKLYEEVGGRFFNSADIAALFMCIVLTWERTANTVVAQKQNNQQQVNQKIRCFYERRFLVEPLKFTLTESIYAWFTDWKCLNHRCLLFFCLLKDKIGTLSVRLIDALLSVFKVKPSSE